MNEFYEWTFGIKTNYLTIYILSFKMFSYYFTHMQTVLIWWNYIRVPIVVTLSVCVFLVNLAKATRLNNLQRIIEKCHCRGNVDIQLIVTCSSESKKKKCKLFAQDYMKNDDVAKRRRKKTWQNRGCESVSERIKT